MSEGRHTEGPWTVEHGDWPHKGTLVITARHAGMTARSPLAHLAGEFDDAAEPDAHLIAAAPDMLEALEQAYAFIAAEYGDAESQALDGEHVSREARPVWNSICTALAKVREGERT